MAPLDQRVYREEQKSTQDDRVHGLHRFIPRDNEVRGGCANCIYCDETEKMRCLAHVKHKTHAMVTKGASLDKVMTKLGNLRFVDLGVSGGSIQYLSQSDSVMGAVKKQFADSLLRSN